MKNGVSGLRYRDILDHYKLILCEDPVTCKQKLSTYQHDKGTFDRYGHIHWSRVDQRVTRRGLRSLLVAVAGVYLKHSASTPTWQRLYEANLWAWEEGMSTWHIQFTQEMSKNDRMRAARLTKDMPMRSINFAAYQWMRGRKKTWNDERSTGTRS